MELPEDVLRLFSPDTSERLRKWKLSSASKPEELRCRAGQPVMALSAGTASEISMPPLTANSLDLILERAVKASVYAYTEEIRRGYLHLSGGARIGLCGTVYERGNAVAGIRALSSLSIRIPHEISGCADGVFRQLSKQGICNTLILSPPGIGKTTLLRDLIRQWSNSGVRVSVADERGEIAAVSDRKPAFDLGRHTDVMSGGSKGESAMMLLRAMNPQMLAFDEITSPEDLEIISQAAGCGVTLLATAHAQDRGSLRQRKLYSRLLEEGIFQNAIWIRMENGRRRYTVEKLMI